MYKFILYLQHQQQQLEEYDFNHSMKERVANFMTLFRYVLPDL